MLVFIGNELPEEFTESESRKSLMGANAKAKANVATAIPELIQIASNPAYEENQKEKHRKNAMRGWWSTTPKMIENICTIFWQ